MCGSDSRTGPPRHPAGGTDSVIGTALLDGTRFPAGDIGKPYDGGWTFEELYKTSKTAMKVGSFAAGTENGVRQEFYARMNLIAAVRLSANGLETERTATAEAVGRG